MTAAPPLALVFAALDGGGGAGLLADCRAIAAAGALPLAVCTALTAQNLDGVAAVWREPPARVRAQFACFATAARCVTAIKAGVLGGAAAAAAQCARQCENAAVVWDPVFAPTSGAAFATAADIARARRHWLPLATVTTPNRRELLQLADEKRPAAAIRRLFAAGARNLLITDIDGRGKRARHVLLTAAHPNTPLWETDIPRAPATYHGTGCLFSSALAAALAHGAPLPAAAQTAHDTVARAMQNALSLPALGRQKLLR